MLNPKRESARWALANFGNVPLGDIRRTDRLVMLAQAMIEKPGSSLPKLCKTWYDTKAIYNLLKSKHMKPDIIQSFHRFQTEEEIQRVENDVLLIEDGSEMSWNGHDPIEGLGPIGSGNSGQQGFLIHSVLAAEMISVEKGLETVQNTTRPPTRILGLLDQQHYIRPPTLDRTRRRRETNEPLETDLWRNTLNRLPIFSKANKRIIRVCDRAADIYEAINETEIAGLHYVIRGRHNRTVENEVNVTRLFDHPELQKSKTSIDIFLRGRNGKEGRSISLNMSWVKVMTKAPSRPGFKAGTLPPMDYGIVRVWEDSSNEERLEWFLLTNLPIGSEIDAKKIVQIYCTRWMIEEYHKALKSGLGAENLQLESVGALMAAIAVMSIVATRLVELRERIRIIPDEPAEASGLDELELKVLSKYLNRELKTVRCVGLAIGRLGGHLNRKRDGMPGIITLWRGMSELLQLVEGARIMLELKR